jgi:hypothetical protein
MFPDDRIDPGAVFVPENRIAGNPAVPQAAKDFQKVNEFDWEEKKREKR